MGKGERKKGKGEKGNRATGKVRRHEAWSLPFTLLPPDPVPFLF